MKWLSDPENIRLIEQNVNRLRLESEIARRNRINLRKTTSNLGGF